MSNLPPGSHSSLSLIYLAVLYKTDDVNKYGYDCVLHPLLQDMKTLEQQGVFIPLLGRCLKGKIQVVAADNLGVHSIAGFNESFSGGYSCGFCTGTKTDIQIKEVRSGAFSLRTKELQDSHVKSAQEKGASCFGVKSHCVVSKSLVHFNVHTG